MVGEASHVYTGLLCLSREVFVNDADQFVGHPPHIATVVVPCLEGSVCFGFDFGEDFPLRHVLVAPAGVLLYVSPDPVVQGLVIE